MMEEEILLDEIQENIDEEINEDEEVIKNEINKLINLTPVIKQSFTTDVAVVLLDNDGKVVCLDNAESFKMDVKIGDKVSSDDPFGKALKTGQASEFNFPEEILGEPVYGKIIPVFSESSNEVISVLITALSLKTQYKIENSTNNLNISLEQTHSTVEDFAGDVQNLANTINEIQNITRMVEERVNEVSSFIETIKDNASTSKILALNASIEAARAGEAGKGFNVVASEMGKLAQSSGEMSTKINNSLNEMFEHLSLITTSVNGANEVATNQAATIEEITATLESIISESAVLADIAKEL